MNSIDSVISSDHYQPVTRDNEHVLQRALDHNVISREVFYRRISSAYIDVQYAMNNDKRETLFRLSQSTQPQQVIPLELKIKYLVLMMLLIIGDPKGTHVMTRP